MCLDPADIPGHCGPNGKGIKRKVYIAAVSQVASIPAPTADTIKVETDIVMTATEVFKTFNIGATNQVFEAESAGDADGSTMEYRPQFFIPKMDGDKGSTLNGLMNGQYIFLFTDRNGIIHIVGDPEDGAVLKVKSQADPNGYLCSVEWDSSHIAYVYTGTIAL